MVFATSKTSYCNKDTIRLSIAILRYPFYNYFVKHPDKNIWNSFYRSHGRHKLHPHVELPAFIRIVHAINGSQVLDVGCGTGQNTVLIGKADLSTHALDNSTHALQLAQEWVQEENEDVIFHTHDINTGLSFNSDSFDGVVCTDTLGYESTATTKKVIRDVHRILKPGGVLLLSLPSHKARALITQLEFTLDEVESLCKSMFTSLKSYIDEHGMITFLGCSI